MTVRWQLIGGMRGEYSVSTEGEVWSCKSRRFLRPGVSSTGYLSVALCLDGVARTYSVHVLVATAFIPNPEGKRTVNHINGARRDPRVGNLEWATHGENHRHAYWQLGRLAPIMTGAADPASKAVVSSAGHRFPCAREAARVLGCSPSAIGRSIRRGTRCLGLLWGFDAH